MNYQYHALNHLPRRPPRVRLQYLYYILAFIVAFLVIEPFYHAYTAFSIFRPTTRLDTPFEDGCLDPHIQAAGTRRESAAIVMLARNSDIEGAVSAVQSLEDRFNRWFKYPYIFLNNKAWSDEFIRRVGSTVSNGTATVFDTIGEDMWGWPESFTDEEKNQARATWEKMNKDNDLTHSLDENYHHMCRFNSGFFFDHPALAQYRYYWRLEPDVEFTCDITYDPFARMAANNKIYGYTIALWEVGSTAPSLFRTLYDYASEHLHHLVETAPLFNALQSASTAPWPIRRLLFPSMPFVFPHRTPAGDIWNMCHFWSNFEIADLSFFRSKEYRQLFAHLDKSGGFYYERWGDAPVHSLAAALLLEPQQVHYFQDIGYRHPPFGHCPIEDVIGCNCTCDGEDEVERECLNRIRETVEPA